MKIKNTCFTICPSLTEYWQEAEVCQAAEQLTQIQKLVLIKESHFNFLRLTSIEKNTFQLCIQVFFSLIMW